MYAKAATDIPALYYLTEDHFFATTCAMYRRHAAGINTYFAEENSSPWNTLFIRVGSAPLHEATQVILELIRRNVAPIRIVIPEVQVDGLRGALTGLGFEPAEKSTTMVLPLARFAPSISEEAVQISLTCDLNEWANPLGSVFSISPQTVADYQARHQRALDADEALYHFILSAEGQVRCSLTLSLCEGEARLSDVGTLIGFRARGYATRLIQAALLHASGLGARRCFLEGSMMAVPLYQKLGFQRLFDCASFVRGPVPSP
ncbi:GNAT family N-acetyltransferase [Pseudomonas fluorescens]|uniref:GNAT family N-acetyltransferase n=1 Tax=Pseudomonas fluorescens TaxID=294 RepID=A0A2N1EBA2_PSEFL|nr:GNAT family N-acetyltransferase [Pseudomonas fluorescens]PKH24095.1 GNAT family N-acetyltransferase [Pseudomonas fluorescens]